MGTNIYLEKKKLIIPFSMVLKEEIFMEKPLGFISQSSSHLVCKPCKALYGLKQAPRAWFEKCFEVLTNLGFKSS